MSYRVDVKPEVFNWAIGESGRELHDIHQKFDMLGQWLDQEIKPTYRQLKDLTTYLGVPFAYMFREKPPKKTMIQSEFRTIYNKMPEMSHGLRMTIKDMRTKQNWLIEYRTEGDYDRLIESPVIDLKRLSSAKNAELAREWLELEADWFSGIKQSDDAFKYLRYMFEQAGITVMLNSYVLRATRYPLDINEFRGFLLYDELAPLIFVNTQDSMTGRIFTLIHEYIHFLLGEDDLARAEDYRGVSERERAINGIVAELLMPEEELKSRWNPDLDPIDEIRALASHLHVSRHALSIRMQNLGFVGQRMVDEVKKLTEEDIDAKKKGSNASGGSYWNNYFYQHSRPFLDSVLEGIDTGALEYSAAFKLLSVKDSTAYEKLRIEIRGRP